MNRILYIYLFLGIVFQTVLYGENITIIGSNYVGLVTAAVFAQCDHEVSCLDIDKKKISQLNQQKLPIYEPKLTQALFESSFSENIQFTSDINTSFDSPIVYLCVGTPTTSDGDFDHSFIYSAIDSILKNYKNTRIICIKSTVQPGINRKIQNYLTEKNRDDIKLVYNPEFMREGSALEDILTKNPLIIASDSIESIDEVEKLYKPIIDKNQNIKLIKTTFETAEIIKYGWNSFSALRVAYINELALLCGDFQADIFTAIIGIALSEVLLPTEIIKPGPGFGGSCLPKDTLSFTKILKDSGLPKSLIHQVIYSNKNHKKLIVKRIFALLDNEIDKKRIAILGLSFKANTDDIRYAPAIDVIKLLKKHGAIINAYDPQAIKNMEQIYPDINYFNSPYEAIKNTDCIVILTEWPEIKNIDLAIVSQECSKKIIFDAKNLYDPQLLKQHGFISSNLGRI